VALFFYCEKIVMENLNPRIYIYITIWRFL